jgi:Uma2 family endonuclease
MDAGQIDLRDLELPLVLRPSSPISDETLIKLSERNRPYRLELDKEGKVTIMTPVNYRGGKQEGYVAASLLLWSEEDGRGSALPANVGFRLPDGSCLAPDAAWLTKEREEALTPEQLDSFPPVCPDFVIEVRSKSDARAALEAKMQLWLDNGAQLAWLIDPIDANVTIYRPAKTPEILVRPEVVGGDAPVTGFVLRCTGLWPTP